uniref:Uncharacterized protein n=1 Tax=Glossina morsitans morsitans TaxID=37546 RepID=A0A1B0G6I5_GLOMM
MQSLKKCSSLALANNVIKKEKLPKTKVRLMTWQLMANRILNNLKTQELLWQFGKQQHCYNTTLRDAVMDNYLPSHSLS